MGWGLSEDDFEDVEHEKLHWDPEDSYNPAELQRSQNRVYQENVEALNR